MNKPVVAHAIRGFLAPTETFVGNQIASLQRYAPVVLAHHRSPSREFDITDLFIMNEQSNGAARSVESFMYRTTKALMPRDVTAAAGWLGRFDPVLWHFHYAVDAAFFLPVLRRLRRPSIVSLYGYDVSSFPGRLGGLGLRYMSPVFDEADVFLAMTEDMKHDAIALGIPEHKIRIHYHGIKTGRFRFEERRYEEKEQFNVLCVGSLLHKKGQHHLLNAVADLRHVYGDMNVKVTFVGSGPLQRELERIICERGLDGCVELAGHVPHTSDALPAYYRDADVFVHFSATQPDGEKEGMPGAIAEAMASGLPVVTTRHAGIPEAITDGVHGVLLDERDTRGIGTTLRKLFEDPDMRRSLGEAARRQAAIQLDIEGRARALENIYDEVAGRTGQ